MIHLGDEIHLHAGRRFRVLDVVAFEKEDECRIASPPTTPRGTASSRTPRSRACGGPEGDGERLRLRGEHNEPPNEPGDVLEDVHEFRRRT